MCPAENPEPSKLQIESLHGFLCKIMLRSKGAFVGEGFPGLQAAKSQFGDLFCKLAEAGPEFAEEAQTT